MGFLDKLKQATGVQVSLRVIEPNANTGIDFEWLRGRFSSMVVGESYRTEDFVNAYAPHVWPDATKRVNQEIRDMVTVELRRDPDNTHDRNAIEVWSVGSLRSPYAWHAGFLHRDVAARVAPVVDGERIRSWRHPAEIHGTVSQQAATFGVTLLPGRLMTKGPDMSGLSQELGLSFRPATEKQIDFVLSLLGAERDMGGGFTMSTQLSKRELDSLLTRLGNPPNWKSRTTWAQLDSHQISVAIDVLKGNVAW